MSERSRARLVPLSPLVGAMCGVGIVVTAAFIGGSVRASMGGSYPLIALYPAVALAAWLGLACGLTATLAAVPVAAYALLEPTGSFAIARTQDQVALAVFVVLGTLVSLISERLHRARRAAERAVAIRDEFLSIAAHELGTPMTALTLQLEALRRACATDRPDTTVLCRRADVALRQAARLQALANDLLDVARLSHGRLELRREEMDLAAVTRDACEKMTGDAERAGCTLTCDAPDGVRGSWDPLRIEQVVTNLISNAVKYGRGKPVHVAVERTATAAIVRVKDQGRGIAASELERIFGRFERAAPADEYPGLGLGLFITRQIVSAHGGRIDVISEPGAGAEFIVRLPSAEDPQG